MTQKVGDKIRYTGPSGDGLTQGKVYEVANSAGKWGFDVLDDVGQGNGIIQRHYEPVTDTPPAPTLWRDMTDAQKGALLLARHQGKVIERWLPGCGWFSYQGSLGDDCAYRVAPEPVVETVALCYRRGHSPHVKNRIGTIDLIDGKPDPDSIRMEVTE